MSYFAPMDRRLQRGAQIALRVQDADGVQCPISIPFEYDPTEFPFLRLCIRHLGPATLTGILRCIIHVAGMELDRTFDTILYANKEMVVTVPAAGIRVAFLDLLNNPVAPNSALPCTIAYDVVPVRTADYKEVPNLLALDLARVNTAAPTQFAGLPTGNPAPMFSPYAVRTEMWIENPGGILVGVFTLYGTPRDRTPFVAAEAVELLQAAVAPGTSAKTANAVIPAQGFAWPAYTITGLTPAVPTDRLRVIEWVRPF